MGHAWITGTKSTLFFQVNSLISRKFAPVGFSYPAATNDALVHATMEKKEEAFT